METYIIRSTDGTESSPVSLEDLSALVKDGKVRGTSMIYTEGSKRWRLAASISEVRDLIREFAPGQDAVLDRIRTEGAASNTVQIKKRRQEREEVKNPFWKRIFGSSK